MPASRTRKTARAKQPPGRSPLALLLALDALRTWVIPAAASLVILLSALLFAADLVAAPAALAAAIAAALILLLYVGERPLIAADMPRREQALGALLAVVWFAVCYLPFYARLFPGRPLIDAVEVTAAGGGLPLRIPAAGHHAIDLLLEGKFPPHPAGQAAASVRYTLTLEDGAGNVSALSGEFEETLQTRRLGRRGTTVVTQSHHSDLRVLSNPQAGDLTVTKVALEPESPIALAISAFVHLLPRTAVLVLATVALFAVAVTFDRREATAETEGALTFATGAAIGTAGIFYSSDTVHPDFRTLIGSAMLGGGIGFAASVLVWWAVNRIAGRPAY